VKKVWVKKIDVSTGSETNQKPHLLSPPIMNGSLNGKRRNFCDYCKISGHWEKKCWNLHPEIRHKPSNTQIAKMPTKKEATKDLVVNVSTPISEETQLKKEDPLNWFGKKWIAFFHS
jgi:hypothetical protein